MEDESRQQTARGQQPDTHNETKDTDTKDTDMTQNSMTQNNTGRNLNVAHEPDNQ